VRPIPDSTGAGMSLAILGTARARFAQRSTELDESRFIPADGRESDPQDRTTILLSTLRKWLSK
jgi:hypothetical protein